MSAARSEYSPDARGLTPRRQLLTVSELEQLFGPDATVELRSGRPEHVETDLEVIPPRRTSRWMAPVLLVIFGAASLLGYALLRSSAPVQAARSVSSWTAWTRATSLGPTEETATEPDYRLPPFVARISGPGAGLPTAAPPPPSAETNAELDATVPAPLAPSAEPAAEAEPVPAALPAPPAEARAPVRQAARAKPRQAPRAAAVVDPARENEATRRLIDRQLQGLDPSPSADQDSTDDSKNYPPGYIEAEIR